MQKQKNKHAHTLEVAKATGRAIYEARMNAVQAPFGRVPGTIEKSKKAYTRKGKYRENYA